MNPPNKEERKVKTQKFYNSDDWKLYWEAWVSVNQKDIYFIEDIETQDFPEDFEGYYFILFNKE